MRKALILTLAGILMVASGVAAVSAYEAHVVNVTAHVENVLTTSITAGESTEFGTVFPQEWHKAHVEVGLSGSALDELAAENLASVNCTLFAEWKAVPLDAAGAPILALAAYHEINTTKYYPWLGEALWVGVGDYDYPSDLLGLPDVADDATELAAYLAAHGIGQIGDLSWVGPAPAAGEMAIDTGYIFTIDSAATYLVGVGLDAPVFEGFYNPDTDPVPKPSKRNAPSLIIQDGVDDPERYFPTGENANEDPAMLGLDLKFQVTEIDRQ